MRRLFALVLLVLGASLITAPALATNHHHAGTGGVTFCHRTDSDGNPYVVITTDPASIFKQGHDGHTGPVYDPSLKSSRTKWGDIIPPFDYAYSQGHRSYSGHYDGMNWTAAGQQIWSDGCAFSPPSSPPASPSSSPSSSPSQTPTHPGRPSTSPSASSTPTSCCAPTAPPTEPPGPTASPSPTHSSICCYPPVTPTPPPPTGPPNPNPGPLPYTGFGLTVPLLVAGSASVLAGLAMLGWLRRRRLRT